MQRLSLAARFFLGIITMPFGEAVAGIISYANIEATFSSIMVAPQSSQSQFSAWSLSCESESTWWPTPTSTGIKDTDQDSSSDGTTVTAETEVAGGNIKSDCSSAQDGVDMNASLTLVGEGQGGETGGRGISEMTIALVADATVTVEVDYEYDLVLTTAKPGEVAEGFLDILLAINSADLDVDNVDTGYQIVRDGEDFSQTNISGTLSVSGDFQAGDEVQFLIDAAMYLRGEIWEVPEPSGLALFTAGFGGFVVLLRRRKKMMVSQNGV